MAIPFPARNGPKVAQSGWAISLLLKQVAVFRLKSRSALPAAGAWRAERSRGGWARVGGRTVHATGCETPIPHTEAAAGRTRGGRAGGPIGRQADRSTDGRLTSPSTTKAPHSLPAYYGRPLKSDRGRHTCSLNRPLNVVPLMNTDT